VPLEVEEPGRSRDTSTDPAHSADMVRRPTEGQRLHVLVVDDNSYVRDLCTEIASSMALPAAAVSGETPGPSVTQDSPAGAKAVPPVVESVPLGAGALKRFGEQRHDIVLLDVRLPDVSGMEVLREVKRLRADTAVIMITGYASVPLAVEAMKAGAFHYLAKPLRPEQIREAIQAAAEALVSTVEPLNHSTVQPSTASAGFAGIIGASEPMQRLYRLIERAASSDSTVLIEGESGSGKELVARAIHSRGPHADEPFLPVDCGAIAESLFESELFGHAEGAFTGAHRAKTGLMRSAGHGTLFLDEIAEIPTNMQPALLRALQEKKVRPVGSSRAHRFHARIVAATNQRLKQAVAKGEFRLDLYYRVNVLAIYVPPLRERRGDIPALVRHFAGRCAARTGREVTFSEKALDALVAHDWPGNVRELENAVERASVLLGKDRITAKDVATLLSQSLEDDLGRRPPGRRFEDYEEEAVRNALADAQGNKRRAARILEIGIATLYRKIKKYGIDASA